MKSDTWTPPAFLVRLFIEEIEKIRSKKTADEIAQSLKSMFEDALRLAVDQTTGAIRYTASQISMALSEALHDHVVFPRLNIVGDPWVEQSGGLSGRKGPIYVEMICDICDVRHVITAGQELLLHFAPYKSA